MTTFRKMMFGRILERDVAVAVVQWTARAYFACAGLLAVTSLLLSVPWMIGVALVFCACAYFVQFKLSRMAAMIGLLLCAASFSLFYRAWPPALIMLALSPLEWMAIRGTEAVFKLHGRFAQSHPGCGGQK